MSKSADQGRSVNAVTKIDRRFRPHARFFNQFPYKPSPALIGWGVGLFSRLTNRLTTQKALRVFADGVLLAAALYAPAKAQETLPTITETMAEVTDTEVYTTGALGMGTLTPATDFWLVLADGTELPVTFDLVDPLGRRLEGCFYSPAKGGTPCAVKAYGYLGWDNATLRFVLTFIEDIQPPEALK